MKNYVFKQESLVTKKEREIQNGHPAFVLWFTGLSGSGKSTLAQRMQRKLFELNRHAYVLDGDNLRHGLCNDLGFSEQDRFENMRRVGEVTKLFSDAGIITIVAMISPLVNQREHIKSLLIQDRYLEIYCKCALSECENRDVKGLYKKARSGEIENFTGISSPYEEPRNPSFVVETDKLAVDEAVDLIIDFLSEIKFL